MKPKHKNYLEIFKEKTKYIDAEAQIIINGHLVIEELLTDLIDLSFFHPEHLKKLNLGFFQKIALARAMCPNKDQDSIWKIVISINQLRNKIAHTSDDKGRKDKTKLLKDLTCNELKDQDYIEDLKKEGDGALFITAISACIGFLEAFLKDLKGRATVRDFVEAARKYEMEKSKDK